MFCSLIRRHRKKFSDTKFTHAHTYVDKRDLFWSLALSKIAGDTVIFKRRALIFSDVGSLRVVGAFPFSKIGPPRVVDFPPGRLVKLCEENVTSNNFP